MSMARREWGQRSRRNVEGRASDEAEGQREHVRAGRGTRTDDVEDALANHGLAARQSDFTDAHVDKRPGDVDDLAVR
jgi:hypothetical protein